MFPSRLNLDELSRLNLMVKELREIFAEANARYDRVNEEGVMNEIAGATEEMVFHYLFFQPETMEKEDEAILRASARRAASENKLNPSGKAKSVIELVREDNFRTVLQRTEELRQLASEVFKTSDGIYRVTFQDGHRQRAILINRRKIVKSNDEAMLGAAQDQVVHEEIGRIATVMDDYKNSIYGRVFAEGILENRLQELRDLIEHLVSERSDAEEDPAMERLTKEQREEIDKKILADAREELETESQKVEELNNPFVNRSFLSREFKKMKGPLSVEQYMEFLSGIIDSLSLFNDAFPEYFRNSWDRKWESYHDKFMKHGMNFFYFDPASRSDAPFDEIKALRESIKVVYDFLEGQRDGSGKKGANYSYLVPKSHGDGRVEFKMNITKITEKKSAVIMIAPSGEEWRGIVDTEEVDSKGNKIIEAIPRFLRGRLDELTGSSEAYRRRAHSKLLDAFEAIGYRYFDKIVDKRLTAFLDNIDEETMKILKGKIRSKVDSYIWEKPGIARSINDFNTKLETLNPVKSTSHFFTRKDGINSAEQMHFANDILRYVVYAGRNLRRREAQKKTRIQKALIPVQQGFDRRYALDEDADELRVGPGVDFRPVNALLGMTEFVIEVYGADHSMFGKNSDQDQLNNWKRGGIDLNPNELDMQINQEGQGLKYNIDVAPITNLQMLLGLGD